MNKVVAAPVGRPVVTPPAKQTAADGLVERAICGRGAEPKAWVGSWDGVRPFDDRDPFLHRGPTTIVITAKGGALHVSEGVGVAGYELDLELDADHVVARGDVHATETKRAIVVDGNMKPTGEKQLSITKRAAVAACLTERGQLAVWRVLDATGDGIQEQHERDSVLLARRS